MSNVGSGSTGQVLQAKGAGQPPAYSTATYPTTTTINQVLYSSANNTVQGLTTANNAVLATNGSGVPSITATPQVTAIGVGAAAGASGVTFDGTNLLNSYTTGTWTPSIRFGGGTTNITYSSQTGKYWKIGNIVFVSGNFVLTSKGISTGNASIAGLPFTSASSGEMAKLILIPGSVVLSANMTAFWGALNTNSTTFEVWQYGNNVSVAVTTDANYGNVSSFHIDGFYYV